MKRIKFIIIGLIVLAMNGCTVEERDLNFLDDVAAPSNLAVTFNVTQDNSGLVTMTPSAEGATSFKLTYGNGGSIVLSPGEATERIYEEGTYQVGLVATGINGLTTEITQPLVVSFQPPQNLDIVIENDLAVSKQVNVTANADFAITYEVHFGETPDGPVLSANIGDQVSHIYENAGVYTITVTVMGAAIETTEYVVDFEVTAILQPLTSAPTPPNRDDNDVVSIFTTAYAADLASPNYFPDWGQGGQGSSWAMFDLNGDEMLQYINLSYQGIDFGEEVDLTEMEYLHLDVWTADVVTDLETSIIRPGPEEAPVTVSLTENDWTSIEIPISDYTDQGLTVADIFQMKFVGTPWASGTVFIDNIYFYKQPSGPSELAGTWKMSPVAGALGVGPAPGDISWWNCDDTCVGDRACYYDDLYVFGTDGSFTNVLGAETFIEDWQGGSFNCGAPVAPHDGSAAATYVHDEANGTVTINGTGAYIGLPKANNQGELPNVAVPSSITYNVNFIDSNNIEVYIEAGAGVFWQFKLIRELSSSPIVGTWQMAPEAGALGVGPAPGDISWWNCDDTCVSDRACYYDDLYVFGADGSFSNVLGAESWIEGWQGGGDACGAPVAPHDGSGAATFVYDDGAGTVTLNGTGAYIGLPKANNQGELPNVAVPGSITYNVTFIDSNTINVTIEAGSGVWWQYKLIKL